MSWRPDHEVDVDTETFDRAGLQLQLETALGWPAAVRVRQKSAQQP